MDGTSVADGRSRSTVAATVAAAAAAMTGAGGASVSRRSYDDGGDDMTAAHAVAGLAACPRPFYLKARKHYADEYPIPTRQSRYDADAAGDTRPSSEWGAGRPTNFFAGRVSVFGKSVFDRETRNPAADSLSYLKTVSILVLLFRLTDF